MDKHLVCTTDIDEEGEIHVPAAHFLPYPQRQQPPLDHAFLLGMFPISADGKRAIGEDHIIFDGRQSQHTIEGPKVYCRGDWLYIFAPAGGVHNGWQTVLRAREIRGKWEDRIVMRQGSTSVNGPHQGAWVTTPDGQDWFLHFQSRGAYGRVVHLQPMNWMEDGWPVIGQQDPHPEAPAAIYTGDNLAAITCQSDVPYGVPVQQYNKPHAPACERVVQEMKDGFCGTLGLQWQFMANWRPEFFTVGGSSLTLHACALPDGAETLWSCPQVLSQKIAALSFTAQVAVDASELRSWEQAGVCILGGAYAYAALRRTDDGLWLVWAEGEQRQEGMVERTDCAIPASEQLVLRLAVRAIDLMTVEAVWAWSSDGNDWHVIGEPFSPGRHTWVGARVGLFCMPTDGSEHGGSAKFGPFLVE